jgi:ribosome-associated protein
MSVLQQGDQELLLEHIVEGIKEKKGKDILSIDLRDLDNSICRYFIICHGDSNTQVNAIANWIEHVIEERLNEKVWHKEGFENASWILLDYVDIIVHIFQKESREFYNLEGLWADGYLSKFENEYFN